MNIYRLIGRILAFLLVLMVVVILVGHVIAEDIPRQFPFTLVESLLFILLFTSLGGLILAWTREALGGSLAILGIALFTLVNSVQSGYFRFNPVFAAIFLAGLLFLISARRSSKDS